MKINQRQLEKAMKKMGMQTEMLDAEEVIIKTPEKDIVISNPQVARVSVMGQMTYQITGDAEERSRSGFTDEDISLVMEKTGADRETAKKALEEEGDIASAILKLKS